MLATKYSQYLQKVVRQYFPKDQNQIFIFGSALRKKHFRDIDIAIRGPVDYTKLSQLRSELTNSTFPYLIDLITFDQTEPAFQNYVLKKEIKKCL